jgi:ferredoxin-nitrite reductase
MSRGIEELKKEVGGLEVWSHIEEAAKQGFEAVNQELVPLFKWYGVYAQKPPTDGYFMIRIKIPGGRLSIEQLLKLNELAERYGRGCADITTRQAIQLHWIRIEDIPQILSELKNVGMDTAGGCGDILRNVTGCPLAGLIEDEVFDASKELIEIDNHFTRNPEFSNLPRKYKMSVTGCATWCSQPDINCISLVGVKHPATNELGFTLKLGGGLSTKPIIAKNFPVFVKREQALELAHAATVVYREFGNRDKRQKARIKFLVEDWGVDKLLEQIETNLGFKLERVEKIRDMQTGAAEYFPSPVTSHHDHLGITKLKNGNYAVGVAFISGRTFSPGLANIANLVKQFCENGEVRTTNKQNLIILNVREDKLEDLLTAARDLGLRVEHSAFHRLGVACTGTEFCNLAIVETKERAKDLFNYLDAKFPDFQEQLMLSVTGCPNNCAQYSIADIGLVGCKVKNQEGVMEDAFRIFLGGRVGDEAQFGKPFEKRYLHKNIHLILEDLLKYYFTNKNPDDSFRTFVDRLSIEKIEAEAIA